jgi:hypothetical protein
MPEAEIVYVNVEPNKFNPEQTQMSIGFKVDEGEVTYMRYTLAGGTEGQQKFASMQISKLLKMGSPYKVNVQQNDRGYTDVYADDGFRSGGGGSPSGGF